jgi:outer membrane protein
MRVNLQDVINIARNQAPSVFLAETRLSNSYWNYQTFRSNYRPLIALNGTFPQVNRSIDAIIQPDGSELFIQRSLMSNQLNLALTQDISATGGRVFVTTGLRRLDIFRTASNPGMVSWLSTPLSLGISQPFYQFNNLKWALKTEPLIYQEAKAKYQEDIAFATFEAVRNFFDVYRNQVILEGVLKDKANADTLLEISRGRFEVGRIAETDLLQIELNAMNADNSIAEATMNLQAATERLRNFLGIKSRTDFILSIPESIPNTTIDPLLALDEARRNRGQTMQFQRRLIEAEREVDRARKANGFRLDLFGSVGFRQTSTNLPDAYRSPLDQEQLAIELQIPIADWGKAKARTETAKSNRDLIKMNVEQDQISFEQEILLKAQQFELLKNRVILSQKSLDVAVKKFEITQQRYMIGKIGITDLNIAIREQDAARRSQIEAIRDYYVGLYEIIGLTLYDFREGRRLNEE